MISPLNKSLLSFNEPSSAVTFKKEINYRVLNAFWQQHSFDALMSSCFEMTNQNRPSPFPEGLGRRGRGVMGESGAGLTTVTEIYLQ